MVHCDKESGRAPQPTVARREQVHTRKIELQGYSREDGLFDIEARLTDTKSYGFETDDRGWIDPGEPLHGMSMRMTIDEDMVIVAFEAATDYSPHAICPQIAPNYAKLAGLRIGPRLPARRGRAGRRRARLHASAGADAADGHGGLPDALPRC